MAPHDNGDVPIYDSLVGEQGDVLAEARQAAEEARHSTHRALNFHGHSPHQQSESTWHAQGAVRT